ncbi:hypothetical protein IWW36_002760 [Coemansia brasiliensis]|uniref:Uncharacterized protein n=1 Tax=Coemansia brasiliensis TaxID=2650707 RepID=A0A9W8I910_9FUNG|nr:hypothetical protein IWW36_002760 [Coemansia brasiliensis]
MAFIYRRIYRILVPLGLLLAFVLWRNKHQAEEASATVRYTPPLPPLPTGSAQPQSCFVFITRTMSLTKVRRTMFDVEQRFNQRYHYPYVFLSEHPFSQAFQESVKNMASSPVHFALIEDWQEPEWIDVNRVKGRIGFRNMVRYWSGPFARHPAIQPYRYIWRLEPGSHYTCDFEYDPFVEMKQMQLKYGFAISMQEIPSAVPSLWQTFNKFISQHSDSLKHRNSTLDWLIDSKSNEFSRCHFITNFELIDLDFMRSTEYQQLFEFLDKQAGIYYEQWSDASIRSLAVALLLSHKQVWWLADAGYTHDLLLNCPADHHRQMRCHCDPSKSTHLLPMSCSVYWNSALNTQV